MNCASSETTKNGQLSRSTISTIDLSLRRTGATFRPVPLQDSWQFPLDILALGLSLPERTVAAAEVLQQEGPRVREQLAVLSAGFCTRLMSNLGIDSVMCDTDIPSRERGRSAAQQALNLTGIAGKSLGLIIDFTTFANDAKGIWSLGHDIQQFIDAPGALVVGATGSGCCGLHLALRTAQAFFCADPKLQFALLVASDRAPDGGRVCLPVSIMADAASAVVIARADCSPRPIGRVRAVITQSSGRFVDVISVDRSSSAIAINSAVFERQLRPLHLVILGRLLARALAAAKLPRLAIEALIYPNTTELDRQSVARALDFDPESLLGPGPLNYGHAFANDLIINSQALFKQTNKRDCLHSAWLAAGSGFTWGAAIVDRI